ncbi:MAG: ribonuclease HI [Clostridia bacterium]|nr:ribonuclease HI [Clostridia bacterium]
MKEIDIFTDGACSGNPGPGGWGAILRYKNTEKEISGGEKNTTNNRMELTAVIEALKMLKEPCTVNLWTDSKYVADGLGKGWAESWKRNGWKKSDKKPALNPELWDELLTLSHIHTVKIHWIKGHVGHPENERCDKLAVAQSQKHSSVNRS